ncbi:MAG: SGNH/GDSL hydrolase family protein [Treponema sp.]|jgi:lysophospholipase L1-like esterase|nr:SGNH/GDSL hydrolase family protein [Treponema sp.]
MKNILAGKKVLFQGDSVTDCGRDRTEPSPQNSAAWGSGYPAKIAALYGILFPDAETVFVNRGVSGNRTGDLLERYERDFRDVKPDLISLLIGINDVWRRYDRNNPTSPEVFEQNYRTLLERIRGDLPKVQIIIMEPFLLHPLPDRWSWHEDLDPKIQVVRKLAAQFADYFLPADGILARYVAEGIPQEHIAADGVHPTGTGHGILAYEWLHCLGIL